MKESVAVLGRFLHGIVRPPTKPFGDLRSWRTGPRVRGLLIFGAVAAGYLLGGLEFVESELTDARFTLLRRPATNDVVLVEIDAASLEELDAWPWPRAYHARIVDTLVSSGATVIAFDIDFSARSSAAGDEALADALARSDGRVILPVFQQAPAWERAGDMTVSAPLPDFARHARLASVNVTAEPDGTVRRVASSLGVGDRELPALFAMLAGDDGGSGRFYIDYGIDPGGVTRIGYADILLGRFDAEQIAGRRVLVGATAMELGDRITVPVAGSLPGPVVQILAYETIVQSRALRRTGTLVVLAGALLIVLLLGPRFGPLSWRRGLLLLVVFGATVVLGAGLVQAVAPVIVDVVPWLVTAVLTYAAAQASRIDRQSLRLFVQRLALRRNSALVRNVFDNSFDGIVLLDGDGTIRSFNRGAERIFGRRGVSVMGKDLRELVTGGITGTRPDLVALRGGPHVLELRRADLWPATVEIIVAETTVREKPALMVFVRDITSQKWAELDADLARRRLRDSIECIHEGFALFDGTGELVLSNGRYRSYAARQGESVEAKDGLGSGVEEVRFKDGICLRVSRRRTDDGGAVVVYSDITELKEREACLREAVQRADAANRAKTEFLANMCHELRTPLNAIIGFSETMTTEVFGPLGAPNYRDYAHDIHDSGRHLLDLINDILDVSKVEAGEMRLNEEALALNSVLEAALRMTRGRGSDDGHRITTDLPDELPHLFADRRSVLQVLLNLLSNAVKFTPEGGDILVKVRAHEDGALSIEITDSGIGMKPEDIPRALTLFGQVEGGLERRYEGTGLGLPLSDRLMRLHGGALSIDSKLGEGTTVTLRFPAERVIRPVAGAESAEARAS